jgi:RNA polymerase sigma-70 factor (ECF subfamily)
MSVMTEPGLRLATLLGRCADGDTDSFAPFYDLTVSRVYGLVLRVVLDPAQAEEVTQETYLDAWRQADRYDPGRGGALAWLLAIARRRAVDRVRSAGASTRRDVRYAVEERPYDVTAELAQRSLDRTEMLRVLDELTPPQREAIWLAYFGGHTHAEVARMLGLPVGTAKTRIRDGLARMREAMGAQP